MSRQLDNVKEFHQTFGAPVLDEPTIPLDRVNLRINLLLEELVELAQASGRNALNEFSKQLKIEAYRIEKGITNPLGEKGNVVEALDALCDIDYVLNGAALEYGMIKIFDLAREEVHRSNMSKVCKDQDEAIETMKNNAKGEACTYKYSPAADGYIVSRIVDGKTIKSINYSPANLEQFIKN